MPDPPNKTNTKHSVRFKPFNIKYCDAIENKNCHEARYIQFSQLLSSTQNERIKVTNR